MPKRTLRLSPDPAFPAGLAASSWDHHRHEDRRGGPRLPPKAEDKPLPKGGGMPGKGSAARPDTGRAQPGGSGGCPAVSAGSGGPATAPAAPQRELALLPRLGGPAGHNRQRCAHRQAGGQRDPPDPSPLTHPLVEDGLHVYRGGRSPRPT